MSAEWTLSKDAVNEFQDGGNWRVPVWANGAKSGDKIAAEAMATDRQEARNRAALIVRAVNSHDDLLAALKEMVEVNAHLLNLVGFDRKDNRLDPRFNGCGVRARAAIAKAESR
jgi:hypothetical protein